MAATSSDDVGVCGWGCAMCTFENESDTDKCAICLTPRHKTPVKSAPLPFGGGGDSSSRSSPSDPRSAKKPRSNSSHGSAGGSNSVQKQIQKPLVAVGSSNEKEALRLKKKIDQLKELGIDLPSNDMIALLARNCYSVMAAVSAYFEQMAASDGASATKVDAEAERRIASACAHVERSFAREPFRLLGSRVMSATLNRSSVSMNVGDRLVLQAENAGKKRLRPGASAGSSPASSASSLSAGIIRVATAHNSLIGRLNRDMETIFQPLMKEGLITLGGVCQSTPASSQMFASFNVLVFVFVNTKVFSIFHEEHPQFHLSDALYTALDMMQPETTEPAAATSIAIATDKTLQLAVEDKDAGLEALFSDFIGSTADEDVHGSETGAAVSPADELAPFLKDITLRDHQKAAVRWMLARENQVKNKLMKKQMANRQTATVKGEDASSLDEDTNPMWEARKFYKSERSYFINRFEKIASLKPPQPPTPCLGGILADDMGMGKTMMMLALTAYQKHFSTDTSAVKRESLDANTTSTGTMMWKQRATPHDCSQKTLIVCPLSLLHQWKNEIDERFRPNTLSVHIYYGDDRENNVATLGSINKSDVVLTTYGVLSKEFEKSNGSGVLVACNWLRVILDEAHSIKNRMTTYFKACASLQATHRWCLTGTPIQNSLDDLFSLLCFLQYDPWSRVSWWKRVVAAPFEQGDEANALGRLKVVLTPILLRRTKHTRDRHGKNIVQLPPKRMELVKLEFSEEERTFYQAVYDKSRAEFNGFVASGTASNSYVAIFALLLRLRQACNHPFLALGRNFEEAQTQAASSSSGHSRDASESSIVSLFQPQKDESMESYYRRISARLQQDMQQASSDGAASKDASALLAEANENNGGGSRSGGLTKSYIENVLAQVEEGLESHECPVCLDPPVNGVLTACAHVLCEQCLRDSLASDPESGCPVCRAVVDMMKVFVLPTPAPKAQEERDEAGTRGEDGEHQDNDDNSASAEEDAKQSDVSGVFMSTKLKQLLHDLLVIRRENEQSVGVAKKRKVVVFSQWTYMLEMIAKLLQANGFAYCMFHGAMNQETRERVLTRFAKESALDVLVISLKAGGVGLNLTCASVVILMDPWWNPGVEDQAIDRVHRLGQEQDVIVKRYLVDATVEDMILQLQQRKEKLAKHVLVASKSGDDKRSERLSLEDLKSFFR